MRRNNTACLVLALVIMFMGVPVFGQGSMFSFSSPRSMGLGGFTVTGFDDASNIILNPAALPKVGQSQVMLTLGANQTDLDVTSDSGDVKSNSSPTLFPFAGMVLDFNSRLVGAGISVSTFNRYHIEYPDSGSTRYQGTELDYSSGSVDLALGFIPTREFAIGVRVGYMVAQTTWNRKQNAFGTDPGLDPVFDADWEVSMDATADIFASAGVIWTPSYRFEMGLTWRPPLAHHFNGSLTVKLPDIQGGGEFKSDLKEVRITIPQETRLGFHWIATERLDLYMDAAWTQYSRVDHIDLTAKKPHAPTIPKRLIIPVKLKDEYSVHAGLEVLSSSLTTVRLGGFFASATRKSGYETALMPYGNRYGVTAGLGLRFSRSRIEIGLGKSWMTDSDITGEALPFPLEGSVAGDGYFGSMSFSFLI